MTQYLNPPSCCNACDGPFRAGIMYDSLTAFGGWANLCQPCYLSIGLPIGQQYLADEKGRMMKVSNLGERK